MSLYCPLCRSEYEDDVAVCWNCRVHLVDKLEPEEGERVWVHLMPVYQAPDEFSALAVQRVLLESEIGGQVRSAQIPGIEGIMKNIKGYWGQVLVAPEDYDRARELVADYLRSLEGQPNLEEYEGGGEPGD
jgi:hypothetical protein